MDNQTEASKVSTLTRKMNLPLLDVAEGEITQIANPAESSRAMKARIRQTLVETDPTMADLWDILDEMSDTNEMVRVNLQQMQLFFNEATNAYWHRKAESKAYLEKIIDKGEDQVSHFIDEERRLSREAEADRKHLTDLAKTIKQLAQEYRQCALQKRYSLPIALVMAWKTAMQAAVWRHVTDENVRRAIAEDVRDATRAIAPVGYDTET